MFKTRDIDYTNCEPDIAKALQSGKHIECACYDSTGQGRAKRWVQMFDHASTHPYKTDAGNFRFATPLEYKRKAKTVVQIARWLDDHNYVCNGKGEWEWISNDSCKMPTYPMYLFCYCDREIPDGVYFPEEWLV